MAMEGYCRGRGQGGLGPRSCAHFYTLPEDCIATVISLTSPGDACRLSVLSKALRSVADSDTVWRTFLPPDCDALVPSELSRASKKQLFRYLCDNPIFLDGGKKSFSLDKWSGKKSYMLSARDLDIIWGNTPSYWNWTSLSEARFPEVAELLEVAWLEIRGRISASWLSSGTRYAAYLVFKRKPGAFGFEYQPVTAKFGVAGGETSERTAYLDIKGGPRQRSSHMRTRSHERMRNGDSSHAAQREAQPHDPSLISSYSLPTERPDGWLEVELGEFFNSGGCCAELEMSVLETKGGNWKGGLILEVIEIRPKRC